MTPKKSILIITVLLGSVLTSCNLYYPLDAKSTEQDHLEIAQKCLTSGDFACAEVEYNALTTPSLKNQKLCTLYISQAGFGLSQMIKLSNNANAQVLGTIANAILPYTAAKLAAVDKAKTYCSAFNDIAKNSTADDAKLGALLKTLSLFTSCAVRLARTTSVMATSDTDTACSTPSTSPNAVTRNSITTLGDGSLSPAAPGMCSADAVQCANDLITADSAVINAGLDGFKSTLSNVPAGAKGAASSPIRLGLQQTL